MMLAHTQRRASNSHLRLSLMTSLSLTPLTARLPLPGRVRGAVAESVHPSLSSPKQTQRLPLRPHVTIDVVASFFKLWLFSPTPRLFWPSDTMHFVSPFKVLCFSVCVLCCVEVRPARLPEGRQGSRFGAGLCWRARIFILAPFPRFRRFCFACGRWCLACVLFLTFLTHIYSCIAYPSWFACVFYDILSAPFLCRRGRVR